MQFNNDDKYYIIYCLRNPVFQWFDWYFRVKVVLFHSVYYGGGQGEEEANYKFQRFIVQIDQLTCSRNIDLYYLIKESDFQLHQNIHDNIPQTENLEYYKYATTVKIIISICFPTKFLSLYFTCYFFTQQKINFLKKNENRTFYSSFSRELVQVLQILFL